MLIPIHSDLFDITGRLKAIDDGYFVVYNTKVGKFEVHNRKQRENTYALTVPYPCLDVRTVRHVRRTRAENAARLFAEIEAQNEAVCKSAVRDVVKKAEKETERALRKL